MTDPSPALLLEQATHAALSWGELKAPPQPVANRENAIFRIDLADGRRGALRLHRVGYQTPAAIEAELTWTKALAAGGFPCPTPLCTRDGTLLSSQPGAPVASLIEWIDAAPIGAMGATFAGSPSQKADHYHRLGQLLADLHQRTDALALPPQPRHRWDIEGLAGETPLWGRFWENAALTPVESDLLRVTRDAVRETLTALQKPDFGLIHADVLQENILWNGTQMFLIDFDDSGYGFRGFDLGTAMIQHARSPDLDDLSTALIEGYSGIDRKRLAEELPLFTLLRALASAGWVMPRVPPEAPLQRLYAERALHLAARWLE
ncbi:MAG: Ser/Thr protein kinase RdoA (MazF antagonist) [Paracoccaceae bacterium]|jgi:Ser/Thr protein kinase RdoA (MazF antagonist)